MDPLRSLYAMGDDFSKLRSPRPKATMSGVLGPAGASTADVLSPAGAAASGASTSSSAVQSAFQELVAKSPVPKVLMERLRPASGASPFNAGLSASMPPPPPPATASSPAASRAAIGSRGEPSGAQPNGAARLTTPGSGGGRTAAALSALSADNCAPAAPVPAASGATSKDAARNAGASGNAAALEPASATTAEAAASGSRSAKPATHLKEWYLRRLGRTEAGETLLAVEGLRCDPHAGASANKPWHSTAIVVRVSARDLRTSSGSQYVLDGPMRSSPPASAGLSPELIQAFAQGFPTDWRDYLAPSRFRKRSVGATAVAPASLQAQRQDSEQQPSPSAPQDKQPTPPSTLQPMSMEGTQSSAIKCNQDTSVSMEGTPERRSNPTSDAAAFVSPILLWFSWLC